MMLPKFVVLKSKNNDKYLEYVIEDGEFRGFLVYSGEAIVSPYNKFEVEAANSTRSDLIHIRSSYNNKYWVRESETSNNIVSAADEPEEDQSKWSCTLFQPIHEAANDAYRFRHVQLGYNVCLWRGGSPYGRLVALYSTPDNDLCDLFVVTDWQNLCILPKYVTFSQNGKYLKCFMTNSMMYLQFGANEPTNEMAGHEVFTENDGTLRLRSTHWSFWRRDHNWIKADSPENVVNANTLFRPEKVTDNIIALRNLGNNNYCKRLTLDDNENCLNAANQVLNDLSKMEFGEYAVKREIYDVQYHLNDARIYNKKILTKTSNLAVNNTPEEHEVTITLGYETSRTSSWETTLGITIGVSMTVTAKVPLIAEAEFEISTEFSSQYSWGKSETNTEKVEQSITIPVPPMSKRKVSVLATRGYCNIPFSYTQRDTLPDGKVVILKKHDGLYTGVNEYAFQTEADVALVL